MSDIQFPLLTQFNVSGAYDPRIADPNTNNGNRDVSLDRIRSIFGIIGVVDAVEGGVVSSDDDDDGAEKKRIAWPYLLRRREETQPFVPDAWRGFIGDGSATRGAGPLDDVVGRRTVGEKAPRATMPPEAASVATRYCFIANAGWRAREEEARAKGWF